jgi:hypothetical protein
MKKLSMAMFTLWVIGLAFAVSAPTQAETAQGKYYPVPSWNETLPADLRFVVLTNMSGEAVLDRETGLVWQRSPSGSHTVTWSQAHWACIASRIAGRGGWRLPTVQELSSLLEGFGNGFDGIDALLPGHPFTNLAPFIDYWSATTVHSDEPNATNAGNAWAVNVFWGLQFQIPKTVPRLFWCVRGGQGVAAPNH